MASLATITDLEARLGRTFAAGAETSRVTALLADASAAVRRYTTQTITTGSTSGLHRVDRGRVWLWEDPVTSITSVVDDDGNDVDYVDRSGLGYLLVSASYEFVTVTYAHGLVTVPDDIVAVVCAMAGRAFGVTPDQTGWQQEQTGPFGRSVGSAAASGAMGMLKTERDILDAYRPVRAVVGDVPVGVWL